MNLLIFLSCQKLVVFHDFLDQWWKPTDIEENSYIPSEYLPRCFIFYNTGDFYALQEEIEGPYEWQWIDKNTMYINDIEMKISADKNTQESWTVSLEIEQYPIHYQFIAEACTE